MRILNQDKDETIKDIIICLTIDEAKELRDSLNLIIKDKSISRHEHIDDIDCLHEITITLYDENNLSGFNPRIVKMIKNDI